MSHTEKNNNNDFGKQKANLEIKKLKQELSWFWLSPAAIAIPAFLALLTIWQGRKTQARQHTFEQAQANAEFLKQRLEKLYVPASMHLSIMKGFFDRYNDSNTSDQEKLLIETEWRKHNQALGQLVTKWSSYLSPASNQTIECVDQMVSSLLTHLAQWELVYRLKHEAKVYDGPVYAGIEEFRYQGFPRGPCGADSVFVRGLRELRKELHMIRNVD